MVYLPCEKHRGVLCSVGRGYQRKTYNVTVCERDDGITFCGGNEFHKEETAKE